MQSLVTLVLRLVRAITAFHTPILIYLLSDLDYAVYPFARLHITHVLKLFPSIIQMVASKATK